MASSHGEPLGVDNLAATKKALGWPCEEPPLPCPPEVYETTASRQRGRRGKA